MAAITRPLVDTISKEVADALDAIAKRHGLVFTRGRGKYTSSDFVIGKISFALPASAAGGVDAPKATARDAQAFRAYAPFSGISADALGFTFVDGGNKLTVTGWSSRKPKNPVQLVDSRGKTYKAPVGYLMRFLPDNLKSARA